MSNNIYNILGKLKAITGLDNPAPSTPTTPIYESVQPRGSITEAVKSLEAKYKIFKESTSSIGDTVECPNGITGKIIADLGNKWLVKDLHAETDDDELEFNKSDCLTESKAKPDFLDVDKDGNKAEPFKKAAKDKNNAKGAFKDMFGGNAKDLTSKLKIKEGQNSEAHYGAITHPDGEGEELQYKFRVKNGKPVVVSCEDDRYWDECQADVEKHYHQMAEANDSEAHYGSITHPDGEGEELQYKFRVKNGKPVVVGCEDSRYWDECQADVEKHYHQMAEGMDDLTDLDSYQFAEPDKDTAVKPASAKQAAAERRRRLQDLEDRKAEKDDWFSGKDKESNVRIHRAKYQDEPEELEEYSQAEYDQAMGDFKAKGGKAKQLPPGAAKNPISTASRHIAGRGEAGKGKTAGRGANVSASKPVVDVYEKAPPGAKAERMVKHIKKGYADDGKLTKKEKGIAYATAWKAKKAGQVEEGLQFGDKIANSKAEMKKAKPAMVKESRVMEETDYFYEKVGKALAKKDSTLDTSTGDFTIAVRKEMVAQGLDVNRARNILAMDQDFLSDVATSYGHYCKEMAESSNFFHNPNVPDHEQLPAPPEEVNVELDEIAALAGLARVAAPAVASVATDKVMDKVLSEAPGVAINGKEVNVGSIEVENVDASDYPDFADAYISYAEYVDGTPLSDDELVELEQEHGDLVNQAAHGSLQGAADFLDEEDDVVEGNEFTKARLDAIAQGKDTFTVGSKTYNVSGDVSQERSVGETTSLNDIRRLSGMEEAEEVEVDEDRDIEYSNTPNEKIAPLNAAIPSGTDLHKSKRQDPQTANKAGNPLEEGLWKSYEAMLNKVKK